MRLAMRSPKRTLGHRNTAELALETNRGKMREGRGMAGEGGMERNKYRISSRGCSVHIYSKKKHEKKIEMKKGGRERRRRERGTDGWKDKRMDREAGFGEQES